MIGTRYRMWFVAVAAAIAIGCGEPPGDNDRPEWWDNYVTEVVSFEPGDGAGYNEGALPDIVFGPPSGHGTTVGSTDVVSLGDGGEIVVGFGDRTVVDGDGADFVVFENPFWEENDPQRVWAELGEVAVSQDGETWHVYECDYDVDEDPPYDGCARWRPTLAFEPEDQVPLDPEVTGGDAFDLADVDIDRANYVRIRDLWGEGPAPTRGFDLDAVGLVHAE